MSRALTGLMPFHTPFDAPLAPRGRNRAESTT
jgi:hypothetical protein